MITEDENWLPISQAAVVLGVSERTIRNYINSDKLPVHKDRGRTYVDVSPMRKTQETIHNPDDAARPVPDNSPEEQNPESALLKIVGAELALRGQVQEMADRADREVDHLRQDLKTTRRFGRLGWTVAACIVLAAAAGGAWYSAEWARMDQRLAQADATLTTAQDSVRADLRIREQTIERLEQRLDAANASLKAEREKLLARLEAETNEKSSRVKSEAEKAAEIEIISANLTAAEKAIQTLREEKNALEEELESKRTKLAQAVEHRVTIWEKNLSEQVQSQGRIMALESELAAARQKIGKLEAIVSALKTQTEELKQAKAAADKAASSALDTGKSSLRDRPVADGVPKPPAQEKQQPPATGNPASAPGVAPDAGVVRQRDNFVGPPAPSDPKVASTESENE